MKTFKLWVHQKTSFSGDELVINAKEFPGIKIGSIVEIYQPDEDTNRLLLQVTSLKDEFQQKETISIEQSVASAFQLRTYQDVVVNVVSPHTVSLDLIELCFKDQYFSRSDMWRFAKTLEGTCVYRGKKTAFSEMRTVVNELWTRGERMTCGYVTENTKVVYRSSTAVVNIFIQMSHEMWEFDAVGDLYFEKANEFLKALFAKWSEKNCCHDVTIVMFSRTFYVAQSRQEFPACMRDCIQEDYMGRFYEDFYRVVVQNERFDEWTSIIIELKKLFVGYRENVLRNQCSCLSKHPHVESDNSTSAQGNLLEVINMSLNVYENFNIDRNFDRTGKIAMVITPGAGVFEVNRELTNVTKQRTIDNGIGMDIVCMAEQPLHVVPLFKFHSKSDGLPFEVGGDYNLPHWINISFYQSASQLQTISASSFVPRIKFGLKIPKNLGSRENPLMSPSWSIIGDRRDNSSDNFPFMDYDGYDAQVFKIPRNIGSSKRGKRSCSASKSRGALSFPEALNMNQTTPRKRTVSDDFHCLPTQMKNIEQISPARSTKQASDDSILSHEPARSTSEESLLDSEESAARFVVGSDTSVGHKMVLSRRVETNQYPTRALINPFAPARMNFKVSSNRRRWIHAFPMDVKGATIRQHCYTDRDSESKSCERQPPQNVIEAAQLAVEARKHRSRVESGSENDPRCPSPPMTRSSSTATIGHNSSLASQPDVGMISSSSFLSSKASDSILKKRAGTSIPGSSRRMQQIKRDWKDFETRSGGWFFGPTGESEWSPSLTLGVDWKSLCIPAHLPVTTDYFPDDETLKKYCLFPAYSLIPSDIFPEINIHMGVDKTGLDACSQIFVELISQRLAQGFQLISEDRIVIPTQGRYPSRLKEEIIEEFKMSIGRIFHTLSCNGKEIKVTRYNPMHAAKSIEINYRYKLQVPDAEIYEPCITTFANQQLEKFNWNYLDHYICSMGQGDYGLLESFRFWRSRFFLLPVSNSATKKIIEGTSERCDIYEERTPEEITQLEAGFLRFMEALNKIRRPAPSRKPHPRKVSVPSVRKATHTQDTSDIKPERGRVRHPSVPAKLHMADNSMDSPGPTRANAGEHTRRPSGATANIPAFLTQTSVDSSQNQAEKSQSSSEDVSNTLTVDTPLVDILSAMTDSVEGLSFLPTQQAGLPAQCFVASEAVTWVECCVEGVKTTQRAVDLLQRMIDYRLISHSSGDIARKFRLGFVLYHIVNEKERRLVDQESILKFHNDWCEVELDGQQNINSVPVPAFLLPSADVASMSVWHRAHDCDHYRQVNVDVDPNNRSDRKEWATAQYHTKYHPNAPFSLEIQWMVATGCILGDLVSSYSRKAGSCGYHLLPVPVDQFALPQFKMADPLRLPIFVPLKLNPLKTLNPRGGLFDEFGSDRIDHQRRLQLFQHAILKRFGFLHDAFSVNRSTSYGMPQDTPLKYVHCSGSIFVLVPDYPSSDPDATQSASQTAIPRRKVSIHSDFVTRRGNHETDSEETVGFLWAWNFMLTKKWRTQNTGDENFQDKMLSDFRRFCSNDQGRLVAFWNDCWARREESLELEPTT